MTDAASKPGDQARLGDEAAERPLLRVRDLSVTYPKSGRHPRFPPCSA